MQAPSAFMGNTYPPTTIHHLYASSNHPTPIRLYRDKKDPPQRPARRESVNISYRVSTEGRKTTLTSPRPFLSRKGNFRDPRGDTSYPLRSAELRAKFGRRQSPMTFKSRTRQRIGMRFRPRAAHQTGGKKYRSG